jgi:hypothetical protein
MRMDVVAGAVRVEVGQKWGLWVYDGAMYERLEIEEIHKWTAFGHTVDGVPFAVGVRRLEASGDLLGDDWKPERKESTTDQPTDPR